MATLTLSVTLDDGTTYTTCLNDYVRGPLPLRVGMLCLCREVTHDTPTPTELREPATR